MASRKDKKKEAKEAKATEAEVKALEAFRAKVDEEEVVFADPRLKHDIIFLKFLRARKYDVDKAFDMMTDMLDWREEYEVDTARERWPHCKNHDLLVKYWPGAFHGVDKIGCPIYVERIGQSDLRPLMKTVPDEDFILFHLNQLETTQQWILDAAHDRGEMVFGAVVIQDLTGLGWRHYYTPGFNLLKRVAGIDEANYPESLRKFFIINAPGIFTLMWKIVRPMLDARTVAKIEILGANFEERLLEYVDADQLPSEWGGTCACLAGNGETCLPQGGAFSDVKDDGTSVNPVEVSVGRSASVDVPIKVDADGSNLAWEFTTAKNDIGFALLWRQGDDDEPEVVIETARYAAQKEKVQGQLDADRVRAGTYVLRFDNTHSYLRGKTVTYQVFLQPPVEETPAGTSGKRRRRRRKRKKKKATGGGGGGGDSSGASPSSGASAKKGKGGKGKKSADAQKPASNAFAALADEEGSDADDQ